MTPDPAVCIKYNSVGTNDPCAICGDRTDPIVGPELFLEGTAALVCRECGVQHAPELVAVLAVLPPDFDVWDHPVTRPPPFTAPPVNSCACQTLHEHECPDTHRRLELVRP